MHQLQRPDIQNQHPCAKNKVLAGLYFSENLEEKIHPSLALFLASGGCPLSLGGGASLTSTHCHVPFSDTDPLPLFHKDPSDYMGPNK